MCPQLALVLVLGCIVAPVQPRGGAAMLNAGAIWRPAAGVHPAPVVGFAARTRPALIRRPGHHEIPGTPPAGTCRMPCRPTLILLARGAGHGARSRGVAPPLGQLQAAASSTGSANGRELSPRELLEQIRQQKETVGWGERFAASFAPKSSSDDFKLNWVGNIDRHQRELFWSLITMLCDRIDPYLRWMRLVHDIIEGVCAKCSAFGAFVANTLLPTIHSTSLVCSRQTLVMAREALVLTRLLLQQASAYVSKGALALVGVSVALPPSRAGHAAEFSVGAADLPWWRRMCFPARSDTVYSGISCKIVRSDVVEPRSATGTRASSAHHSSPRFSTDSDSDCVLFPSSSSMPPIAGEHAGTRNRGKASSVEQNAGKAGVPYYIRRQSATPTHRSGGGKREADVEVSRSDGGVGSRFAELFGVLRSVDILI